MFNLHPFTGLLMPAGDNALILYVLGIEAQHALCCPAQYFQSPHGRQIFPRLPHQALPQRRCLLISCGSCGQQGGVPSWHSYLMWQLLSIKACWHQLATRGPASWRQRIRGHMCSFMNSYYYSCDWSWGNFAFNMFTVLVYVSSSVICCGRCFLQHM